VSKEYTSERGPSFKRQRKKEEHKLSKRLVPPVYFNSISLKEVTVLPMQDRVSQQTSRQLRKRKRERGSTKGVKKRSLNQLRLI